MAEMKLLSLAKARPGDLRDVFNISASVVLSVKWEQKIIFIFKSHCED